MKRAFDIVLILVSAPLWLPVMAVVALVVRLGLGQPILFRQHRAGLGGKPFTIFKFRTMREGAESDAERLTHLGSFLRASSLDELPELINVLRGEMSLVGPRPLPVEYLPRYTAEEMHRHDVLPGITGWAQVNGRNLLDWETKFRYDLEYVAKRSFAFDLKILLMTVVPVCRRLGIAHGGEATMDELRPRIDFSKLDSELLGAVREICELAKTKGGRALVVGGAVRDLVLGSAEVKDIDLEVYGIEPERLKRIIGERFEFNACGISFGVMKLKHFDIDIALPRRESKRGEGHRAFFVDADSNLTIPEAASRRDFTVNAMYADPLTGELIDPYGGLKDLRNLVLRHVSEKFREDPLRVLRGMQFVARFGLNPAPETIRVCSEMRIEGLAAERLYEEWSKLILKGKVISSGLEFLHATGWISYFPEFEALSQSEHCWRRTLSALDRFAASRNGIKAEDLVVGFAVLCRHFGDSQFASDFLRRLTNEEMLLVAVPRLVAVFSADSEMLSPLAGEGYSDGNVRRLALKVKRIDRLVRVMRAYGEDAPADCLEKRAIALGVLDTEPQPILMGRHLIELGLKPGKDFNRYLQVVFDAQLDGKFSDLKAAIEYFHCQKWN